MSDVDLDRGPFWFGGAGIGNLLREVSDDDARATVDAAWDVGVRGFDTAPHYGLGLSERRLGAALAGRPRDEYAISTKVGRRLVPGPGDGVDDDGFAVPNDLVRQWDPTADGVRRSLDESLDRLGLDRVDIAYLHDPDVYDLAAGLTQALPALAALRDEGVVRAVGVGSNSVAALTAAVETGLCDVVMLAGRYTLLEQPAAALVDRCAELDVDVVAVGVYNSGLLSRPLPAPDTTYDYAPAPPELVERARALAAVCGRHGVTLPETAVAFPLRAPAVRAIAVGAQSAEQVRSNAERAAVHVPAALWDELRSIGLLAD
ncbi:oxidoreductase [Curtobacterium citreum]|uniref:Aldo/keto reductase n=1 Tax=Curtobacterium citreum TaxID=2036 RepID=A0ABT2HFZ8_9MICO|nr:aldo/keto reductase [Curtobacterium citreum]KTR25193.1 aldo/keto reductase [Curtobacterium citreum]MCS6522190.1 aldo/keto reductase [Curtobacterium citreum]TQJ29314.1 D-threo-aldose 1-dehydrogenase [Curtobacterium citreum]GGL81179.1 oxidoreductase [Curtobacterium citreum]